MSQKLSALPAGLLIQQSELSIVPTGCSICTSGILFPTKRYPSVLIYTDGPSHAEAYWEDISAFPILFLKLGEFI